MNRIDAVARRVFPLAGFVLLGALFGAGSAAGADRWTAGVPYQYDGAGNIEWMGADQQVYDGAGRLVSSATNGVTRTFTYDAFGNRLTCTQEASPCQYLGIDAATNRIEGVPYDAAGNVEYLREHAYGYDALNMLTSDTAGGGAAQIREEYLYTADDERIAVYTRAGSTPGKGSWRWTVRDESGKVLRELTSTDGSTTKGTANWRWVRDYAYREGQLLASRQNGTSATHHYHLDHLGTPRRVTDDANSIVGRHTYHAFGPEEPGDRIEEAPLSPLKYTGHERDGNLDYMHARYYSPEMGRFLSVDPAMDLKKTIRNPQMWNRYSYVVNNPVRYTDPDGREHVQEPGFTKPLSEAGGWADQPSVSWAFYAQGALLSLGADEYLIGPAIGRVASGVVGLFRRPVLLGENMTRVTAGAKMLGAKTFGETGATFAETMAKNMNWLAKQVKSGAKILDVGLDVSRGGRSGVFYKAEVAFLEKAGYTRQFVKLVEIDGKTYRMFEWVRAAR